MLIQIIGWIIMGLLAGFIATKIVGAPADAFDIWSLLFATIAAAVALAIWHAMRWRSATRG